MSKLQAKGRCKSMFSFMLRQAIAERDGMHCAICKLAISTLEGITVDHKIPLSKGGKSEFSNVQLAHGKCNERKGNA